MKFKGLLLGSLFLISSYSFAGSRSIFINANGSTGTNETDFKIMKCNDGDYAITNDPTVMATAKNTTDPCDAESHSSVSKGAMGALSVEKTIEQSGSANSSFVYFSLKGAGSQFLINATAPNESDLDAIDEIRKCVLMMKNAGNVSKLAVSLDSTTWSVICNFE